jgi:hypothetical protein
VLDGRLVKFIFLRVLYIFSEANYEVLVYWTAGVGYSGLGFAASKACAKVQFLSLPHCMNWSL